MSLSKVGGGVLGARSEVTGGGNGDALPVNNIDSLSIFVAPTGGTATVEVTCGSAEAVAADTALWCAWQIGDVADGAVACDVLYSAITHIRLVAVADAVMEVCSREPRYASGRGVVV